MKKDKFKRMRLRIQTLEETAQPEHCVLLLTGLQMETPEAMNLSMESVVQKKIRMEDGTLSVELEGRGIRSDSQKVRQLRIGKQAELLDYHYFKSRLPVSVVTDVQAELFDFRQKRNLPFEVKKLEFHFNNGKKVDYTERVSVWSLNQLAS